ncbi:MAG: NAD(P)H-binding protein [Anaerolineae bacterium]|nr:NAD(P)H-binding protein [Anaerolineae bacterium]
MIVVTGATGFIGRSVMRQLNGRGIAARPYIGRINDAAALRDQLADVETVIHLAGAETRGRKQLLHQVDVLGTEQVVKSAQFRNVQRIILLSRLNANPNALFTVLRVKGRAEQLVSQSNLDYTIIRSATVFGHDDRFTNMIAALAKWTWPFAWIPGHGTNPMQPLWVEDLARILADTVTRTDLDKRTIEVAGEERLRYEDILQQVLTASGMQRLAIRPRPQIVRTIHSLLFNWWYYPPVTRFELSLYSAIPDVTQVDSVRSTFGFHPQRLGQNLAHLRRRRLRWHLFALPPSRHEARRRDKA